MLCVDLNLQLTCGGAGGVSVYLDTSKPVSDTKYELYWLQSPRINIVLQQHNTSCDTQLQPPACMFVGLIVGSYSN